MKPSDQNDNRQKALWNGTAGHAWVDAQALLDQMFEPFENLLVESVRGKDSASVLDIGCGTGSTTIAVARRLGINGSCTGIDISEPMITAARGRASSEILPVNFVVADAQDYAFTAASVDVFISRFGVMFFGNPPQAFANLKRAARKNAELRVIAWRSAAENPFMTTAERAAAPLLPNIPAREPNAPGQFAFADRNRVHRILEDAGWRDIDLQRIDIVCTFPESELTHYLTRLGPLGLILQDADERTRNKVITTVRAAFEPYVNGPYVQFDAACWLITAR